MPIEIEAPEELGYDAITWACPPCVSRSHPTATLRALVEIVERHDGA